jgi:hypothetical protein
MTKADGGQLCNNQPTTGAAKMGGGGGGDGDSVDIGLVESPFHHTCL